MFRVFIVDDDPNFRTLIGDLFRYQHDLPTATLEIITVASAQEALTHPDWMQADFLIADYRLGRKSLGTGAALIRLLRQEQRQLPALLITSEQFAEREAVDPAIVAALEQENTWFLPKHELGWDTLGGIVIPVYENSA